MEEDPKFDNESIDYKPVPIRIPEMKVGQQVMIINKEHPLFLEIGVVVDKSHCHYLVNFTSLEDKINGKNLWIPEHWLDPVPKELRRDAL